jgi:hypothetical protein
MKPAKRKSPYIWVTWLPKYLVGRDTCLWSLWYRAHYQNYAKVPGTFDSVTWNLQHTAALSLVEKEYRQKYDIVQKENQNAFYYQGRSGATISGKPDLIGFNDKELRICDVKTGQRRDEHWVQMMLYMYFYPRCYSQFFSGLNIVGELSYPDGKQEVYMDEMNGQFRVMLTDLLKAVTSDTPPVRIPGASECANCNISGLHCSERVENMLQQDQVELGEF